MIYHPESIGHELYDLLDLNEPSEYVWLDGDQKTRWGWQCRLSKLENGRWAYNLSQCRGEYRTWSNFLRGMYTERYDAIAACIRELRLHYRKHELYAARLKQRAETE